MSVIRHDVIIVGAGLAGSMAALQLADKYDVAVLAKCYPAQSHSSAAQGGIAAAIGNMEEDRLHWHWFDTVKGGDYLTDQDAAKILVHEAPEIVYEMEHMGCPFSRNAEGKIAQRKFGGHTRNYGEAPVLRACFSADRTGHALLHTLFEQLVKYNVHVYPDWVLADLLIEDGVCRGIVAWNMRDGELHVFHAKAVMFATGGGGQAFLITSNAFANTGDGLVVAYNAGVPLQDMEFFQFHPTGIWQRGILLTEGCRGEGGTLINDQGERFMEKYSPKLLELAPRDLVTRSITTEILEGRGIGGKDYVYLDMRHLGAKKIMERLPDVHSFILTYLGMDCIKEPVPIQPTAHYMMGGIPVDVDGQAKINGDKTRDCAGFFAAGECSCVSVHGANRLGTNSLLEAALFGKRAGRQMAEWLHEATLAPLPADPMGRFRERIERFKAAPGGETQGAVRRDLKHLMREHCGVYRTRELLQEGLEQLRELKARFSRIRPATNNGRPYNLDLKETIELENTLTYAEVMMTGALAREETRGGHARRDFPKRDDVNWMKHTLAHKQPDGTIRLSYSPVALGEFEPMERKY